MKLPSGIKTRHKIRDAKICEMAMSGSTNAAIAKRFNLTPTRIAMILYTNREILKAETDWQKVTRVRQLNRLANKADTAEIAPKTSGEFVQVLEQLRKELEGDKAQIETHNHFVIYRNPQAEKELISPRESVKNV